MSDQDLLKEMVRQIEELKTETRRLASLRPQFTVTGVATEQSLTADQNNFALGSYDTVILNPTAARTINGIDSGVKGRVLFIYNSSGSFTISFTNLSASALTANRIQTPTSGTIVLGVKKTAMFQYLDVALGATRWLMMFPAA